MRLEVEEQAEYERVAAAEVRIEDVLQVRLEAQPVPHVGALRLQRAVVG